MALGAPNACMPFHDQGLLFRVHDLCGMPKRSLGVGIFFMWHVEQSPLVQNRKDRLVHHLASNWVFFLPIDNANVVPQGCVCIVSPCQICMPHNYMSSHIGSCTGSYVNAHQRSQCVCLHCVPSIHCSCSDNESLLCSQALSFPWLYSIVIFIPLTLISIESF